MSTERAKILQMVADGTITPEEAEKLLSRIDTPNTTTAVAVLDDAATNHEKTPLKYLRVVVDGEDKVNVRVPIALIRTGIKLSTLVPLSASEHLTEHGIDLSQFNSMDGEELIEALRELQVEVDAGDGDTVRVFCE